MNSSPKLVITARHERYILSGSKNKRTFGYKLSLATNQKGNNLEMDYIVYMLKLMRGKK